MRVSVPSLGTLGSASSCCRRALTAVSWSDSGYVCTGVEAHFFFFEAEQSGFEGKKRDRWPQAQ
jgi:hypothetical protein